MLRTLPSDSSLATWPRFALGGTNGAAERSKFRSSQCIPARHCPPRTRPKPAFPSLLLRCCSGLEGGLDPAVSKAVSMSETTSGQFSKKLHVINGNPFLVPTATDVVKQCLPGRLSSPLPFDGAEPPSGPPPVSELQDPIGPNSTQFGAWWCLVVPGGA